MTIKYPTPTEIRLLIDDEINGGNSLRDSQKALDQLGCLIETSEAMDIHAISHMTRILSEKIGRQIDKIEGLTAQLK